MKPEATGHLMISPFFGRREQIEDNPLCFQIAALWQLSVYISKLKEGSPIKQDTIYQRGEIYLAQLPPACGSVQSGVRPVLLIQNNTANFSSPTLITAPLTTKLKKPFIPTHLILMHVPGLKHPSMVLFEQIMTIDKHQILQHR